MAYCLHGIQKVGGSNPLAPTTSFLPQSPFMTGLVASPPSRRSPFRTGLSDTVQRQPERRKSGGEPAKGGITARGSVAVPWPESPSTVQWRDLGDTNPYSSEAFGVRWTRKMDSEDRAERRRGERGEELSWSSGSPGDRQRASQYIPTRAGEEAGPKRERTGSSDGRFHGS
jgi:hypothetical protein